MGGAGYLHCLDEASDHRCVNDSVVQGRWITGELRCAPAPTGRGDDPPSLDYAIVHAPVIDKNQNILGETHPSRNVPFFANGSTDFLNMAVSTALHRTGAVVTVDHNSRCTER